MSAKYTFALVYNRNQVHYKSVDQWLQNLCQNPSQIITHLLALLADL